jgi:2-methylisocitrate lyase-like PEP mutase family enzyme
MVAGLRDIVEATDLPCMVDADDGYGDVKGVTRTIRSYEAIGIAGCLLEDQSREGKLPGATPARAIIPLDEMERKLRAALAARRDKDFVIIGRTDALGLEGIDGAIRRAEHFLKIGADGVFVAGLKTVEQYERVGKAFKGAWNCAAIFEGGKTPWLTPTELHTMGFSQIAYPNMLMGRVAKALDTGLNRLRRLAAGESGAFAGGASELALDALSEAVQQDRWKDLEKKFTPNP